jgi:SAM-dependent methyltransferase
LSRNASNIHDTDAYKAEWYDRIETGTDDIEQIRRLITGRGPWRILEPFCGTGRILVPLALDGHELVGMDQSKVLLGRCREKVSGLADGVRDRVSLIEADVTLGGWPVGFDLVVLGGNCFYELATPEEQEGCIASAAEALKPGGYVYVDSDHMEGELDPSWQEPGVHIAEPFICADGTKLQFTSETIWFDAPGRLWRSRRRTIATLPDGTVREAEVIQQKHPVSADEVRGWIEKHGFAIERNYGNTSDEPYRPDLNRATFWARKS